MSDRRSTRRRLLAGPYIVWMVLFTLVPLAMIFVYGFTAPQGGLTMANILAVGQKENLKALLLSLKLSLLCTVICLLLAYPLAMILRNNTKSSASLIVFIFILPMWMNFLLRTLAWQILLENNGVINTVLTFFGLPKAKMINTEGAIVLGMVYNYLPFMVLPLYNVLTKIDDSIFEAARDLGANSFWTFVRVTVPLSVPGIISGITMVFVPALTTFVISDLLGGGKILLIGNVIEQKFTTTYNWNVGSGLSIVLMIFVIGSMAVLQIFDKDGEGTAL